MGDAGSDGLGSLSASGTLMGGHGAAVAPCRLRENGTLKDVLALCLLVPELMLELKNVPAGLAAPVLAIAPARPAPASQHRFLCNDGLAGQAQACTMLPLLNIDCVESGT